MPVHLLAKIVCIPKYPVSSESLCYGIEPMQYRIVVSNPEGAGILGTDFSWFQCVVAPPFSLTVFPRNWNHG
jgi:hypothetical protein